MLDSFDSFHFSPKQQRMLDDDSFFLVQEDEVISFLRKMKQAGFPKSEIIRIRKKYDHFIHDKEKELMVRLNLNYEEHDIEHQRSAFTINGYTETQWCLLNVDDYTPKNIQSLFQSISTLKKAGKHQAAEQIEAKYQDYVAKEKKKYEDKFRSKHTLPDDIEVSNIYHNYYIENLPPAEWRCFNDPSYIPSRHTFTKLIEKYGNYEDLTGYYFLFDKYSEIFAYESGEPPVSLEEAHDIFDQLFGKSK